MFVADVVESKRILSNTQCLDNFELSPFFILKNLVEEDVVGGLIFLFLLFFGFLLQSKERFIFRGPSDSKKMKPILVPPFFSQNLISPRS